MPSTDLRRPVSSIPKPSRRGHLQPAGSHGRPNPYAPTEQKFGKYKYVRGNRPENVSQKGWIAAFNNASHAIYTHALNLGLEEARRLMIEAREDGTVRDNAINALIREGVLDEDFVDDNS